MKALHKCDVCTQDISQLSAMKHLTIFFEAKLYCNSELNAFIMLNVVLSKHCCVICSVHGSTLSLPPESFEDMMDAMV